jgi:hypothetical protein
MHTEGSIAADMKLTGSEEGWIARGNFNWRDGGLLSGDNGFSLQGIDLELPVWYQTGKFTTDEEMAKGRLSIETMVLPFLSEQSINLPLNAGPNGLFVTSRTNLSMPGGSVEVGLVAFKDLFSGRPSIETSLTMKDIEINPLLSKFWSLPIQGTMNGKLDPIHLDGDTLSSHGGITAYALQGELVLSNIGASNLFTAGPAFRLDAKWQNLNLEELTTGTSFGKIEGILQGRVKGLEVAYGQPQAFDLLLETVERQGVSQKISIKAIENIAQIGGGQSPFMGLAGSFAAFFKQFPYEKIGVHSTLENDVFRINGTVLEGGTEYLVKRGGISGVNIVNQNPDSRVSFRDMVKRIKRVTTSQNGPVVK